MDIRQAFALLLSNRERCGEIGITDNYQKQMRLRLRDNHPYLSEATMKKWLLKAGFRVTEEWTGPAGFRRKRLPEGKARLA